MHEIKTNVFSQLGEPDAQHLRLRAELMAEIKAWIDREGLTEQETADALGAAPQCISDIRDGRIDKCEIDVLVTLLTASGANIEFLVKHREQTSQ